MNAIVMTGFGDAGVLQYQAWDMPEPKPGEVLIKVQACSVNPIDWRIRNGELKLWRRERPPLVLGADLAGEVAKLGAGVTRFRPGDAVWTKLPTDLGAYAEYVSVPESIVGLRPSNLSPVEAAAVPAGAMTALQAMRDVGELKSGQSVLVNGASGGVGTFAVQLARVLGAHVTAVCGATALELVKRLGAQQAIDYRATDFMKLGRTWDVVFDVSATRSFKECHDALTEHGVYVTTIGSGGDMVMPLLNPLRSKKGRYIIVKSAAADLDELRALTEAGKLKPVVDRVFPLREAAEAQRYIESGKPRGKVVLQVQ